MSCYGAVKKAPERKIAIGTRPWLFFLKYIYDEANEEPVVFDTAKSFSKILVFHWKYNSDDIDVSEEIIVDTLMVKKISKLKDEILSSLRITKQRYVSVIQI